MEGFQGEGAGASRDPQAKKHGLLRQQDGVEPGHPEQGAMGELGRGWSPPLRAWGPRGSFQGVQRADPTSCLLK